MRITVAICTWNRAELLRQTLEGIQSLRVPRGLDWELLIVNNNCTDHTDAIIKTFGDRLPIRGLVEPEPGQSNARNAAARHATSDYIIWTDAPHCR